MTDGKNFKRHGADIKGDRTSDKNVGYSLEYPTHSWKMFIK